MKRLFASMLVLLAAASHAQELSHMLPDWAGESWKKDSARLNLRISTRVNPFVWRGDFNGDGPSDLALSVESTATGKQGILFLLQGQKSVLIGAGVDFGNGGDDFKWMNSWHVEDRGTSHGNYRGDSVKLVGDGLVVEAEETASALIYWKGGKPQWHQYGD